MFIFKRTSPYIRQSHLVKRLPTWFLICFILISTLSHSSFASPSTTENINNIDILLNTYHRDQAYDLMKETYAAITPEMDLPNTLKLLEHMVKLERFYGLYDQMVIHAIKLYNLTTTEELAHYRLTALDALAYYDYVNYSNAKMFEKLEELVQLPIDETQYPKMSYYYTGAAYLSMDEQSYDEAFEYFLNALEVDQNFEMENGYNRVASLYTDISVMYRWQEKYDLSIKYAKLALDETNSSDVDSIYDLKLALAHYYYKDAQYENAKIHIEEATALYPKLSKLYTDRFEDDSLNSLTANIAYAMGDYRTAANYYNLLFGDGIDHEKIQKSIAAQTAVSEFELSSIRDQINLLESLESEQSIRIEAQKSSMTLYKVVIGLLIFILIMGILALNTIFKQKNKFYHLSIIDQLTQTFNRTHILNLLEKHNQATQCIALMDLDYFKEVNDTYGHIVGDEVLRKVSETIKRSLRPEDSIGRYGGEEFLLIINTDAIDVATTVAERIRSNIEKIEWTIPDLKITASIGLVMSQKSDSDLLLYEADRMLYKAKDSGRNRVMYEVYR